MFGYATDETEECMPLTIILAHKLNARLAELRRTGELPWLRPDSKTQVNTARGCPESWKTTPPLSRNTGYFLRQLMCFSVSVADKVGK